MARPTFHHHSISIYINELLPMHGSLVCFSWGLFLGPAWRALVVFKWQWFDWISTHPAGNHHTTGQKAWPSNWLLFVISTAQMGLRWDYMWPDLTKAGFHTQNGKADFSPPLDFYINELTIHVCISAIVSLVCFSWGLFLGPVWRARMLGWSSNGSGVNRQAPTWLEITTRLARKLSHQIGYYLWHLELKWPQMRPSSSVNFNTWKNPPLLWLPTTPDLHPYMIICDSGIKTI